VEVNLMEGDGWSHAFANDRMMEDGGLGDGGFDC